MLATKILILKRLFLIVLLFVLFGVLQSIGLLLSGRKKIRHSIGVSNFCVKIFLKILGAKVEGECEIAHKKAMVVSNHLSWLDPLVYLSKNKIAFVTSTDVKSHSFLGKVTRLAGCFFVNRSAHTLRKELKNISQISEANLYTGFFPEATTGRGLELLPFKPALLNLSFQCNIPVQVFCIRYKTIDGEEVNEKNIDRLNYYGNDTFKDSFSSIIKMKSWSVEILKGSLLFPQDFLDRKEMSIKIKEEIEALLIQ